MKAAPISFATNAAGPSPNGFDYSETLPRLRATRDYLYVPVGESTSSTASLRPR